MCPFLMAQEHIWPGWTRVLKTSLGQSRAQSVTTVGPGKLLPLAVLEAGWRHSSVRLRDKMWSLATLCQRV